MTARSPRSARPTQPKAAAPARRVTAPGDESKRSSALSPRQLDCLSLAAKGNTSAEVARTLGISPRTVDQHIAEACARLGVRNRTQAVAKSFQLGLPMDESG